MPAADFGGPNARPFLNAASLRGTRTVAASASTSQRRQSAHRRPEKAATVIRAIYRGGIWAASASTWATVASVAVFPVGQCPAEQNRTGQGLTGVSRGMTRRCGGLWS
ncbi:hypothetical protein [Actinoplanes derwentensis]|uniref:hypothetical protein n=1 Tax=Actinoplanes derwentensis TaxID=113562 RepID=UPI000B807653|nr:hypothetical protein [Actinoplanes derwentensis]GID87309.1 hypothetical protein Ade03nite_62330 [Actinoplanes derwentensis]